MTNSDNKPFEDAAPEDLEFHHKLELRQRAEKTLQFKRAIAANKSKDMSLEEFQQAFHDLQVYQIELIMQNEELRQSEENLKMAKEVYTDLYDFAPIGYCTISENGVIVNANLFIATMVGVNRSRLISQHFSKFITKVSANAWYLFKKQVISTTKNQICELEMVKSDGASFWVELIGISSVDKSELVVLSMSVSDISVRKLSEQAIIESQNLLNLALEGTGDGIWDWHISENKVFVSRRWLEMFGYKDHHLIESFEEWQAYIYPIDLPTVLLKIQVIIEGNGLFCNEHRVLCKDGSLKWVLARGKVVSRSPSGIPWRMIMTISDISRLKHAEQQLVQKSKMESLGEMSAGIAHEIKNPLAIIYGATKLLSTYKESTTTVLAKVSIIKGASERIEKIVNGLKKFARVSESKQYFPCSLSTIIKDSLFLTELKDLTQTISITYEINSDAKILCDQNEFEQILINLIGNAIDATKSLNEKWIKVEVFENKESIVLRIIDSGKGIPEKIQSRIFDPFFTTKPVGEGTGLGLSIIKGLIEEHGATIKVDSTCPNTCFEIRLKKVVENPND